MYETLLKLLITAFIIRFYVNQYRLGGNPIVENLNKFTLPITLPFHSLFSNFKTRYDFPALLTALIIALLGAFIQYQSIVPSLAFAIFYYFLGTWINVLIVTLFVSVLGSWFSPSPTNPVMQIAHSCTHWMTQRIRKIIPSFGGLDFSPILLFFALNFANKLLYFMLMSSFK